MSPLELAEKYMSVLFSDKGNLSSLYHLLHKKLIFNGPLYSFYSSEEYISSLRSAPPVDFTYTLQHKYEDKDSATLIYQFQKEGVITPMSQSFKVKEGRISEILLIFDTQPFQSEEKSTAELTT
jgi:hypothetical protein